MLAVAPRLLVPRLGPRRAVLLPRLREQRLINTHTRVSRPSARRPLRARCLRGRSRRRGRLPLTHRLPRLHRRRLGRLCLHPRPPGPPHQHRAARRARCTPRRTRRPHRAHRRHRLDAVRRCPRRLHRRGAAAAAARDALLRRRGDAGGRVGARGARIRHTRGRGARRRGGGVGRGRGRVVAPRRVCPHYLCEGGAEARRGGVRPLVGALGLWCRRHYSGVTW